jgi:PhnB protein
MRMKKDNRIIEAYLFFNGRCEEALQLYGTALGAKVEMLMRYKESPEPHPPDMVPSGFDDKVMHCSFRVGQSRVMASDGCSADQANFEGFALSVSAPTEADADRMFGALAEGGEVRMPLAKTFWSPRFGMVTDRFGILWMVSVEASPT